MDRGRLRFAVVLVAFAAVVFFTYREAVLESRLAPLVGWTAQTTASTLELLEVDVSRQSTILSHRDGFAYEVYFRCTGILPVATLAVVILAFPVGSWRKRLAGLAVGVPLILAVNLVRLVTLFQLGVARPELFSFAHSTLWEAAIVLTVAAIWTTWLAWVRASARIGIPCPASR